MAVVGTYSVGGSASAVTVSYEYSTLDELLVVLPDNWLNLIDPVDIRNSVYTLWQQVGYATTIAASAASASSIFTNSDPTTVTVGGLTSGTTFASGQTMQQMWDQLLYPYVLPSSGLSISGGLIQREYGNPNGLISNSITLNWSVTRNTSTVNINTITVDGLPQFPSGSSQVGTKAATGTHSWNTSNVYEDNIFSMSSTDTNASTVFATASITWMNRIYWGNIDLSSIQNPNLTFNSGSASMVGSIVTDIVIQGLAGAGAGSGNQLSTTKSKTYTDINGTGKYLIFAWPSSVSGSTTPTFYVNGFISTAFTKVRGASLFTNQYLFKTNYEVWVSNTRQYSPLTITIT